MSDTKESPGDDSEAVIPPIGSLWGSPYAHKLPGSGLVSTLSDLTAFFHSILDHSIMSTETAVLDWLKPSSFASGSPYYFAGMPWEIYRGYNLTPEHPHNVDMYGKSGGAPGYHALRPNYSVAAHTN
ncbi:hypothetical protein N658DRAFT_340576 [Parathielavia hyrcaniae]|uniref:Uncharacterized protein n=1 Tax=Parathielavia hyrcaniae TaxID=113614 RepID=A0AAN6Q5D1_9PEZI|nr:hypothetical protein N658DRAFT_340576 [Parathielavia hyrcaniae]